MNQNRVTKWRRGRRAFSAALLASGGLALVAATPALVALEPSKPQYKPIATSEYRVGVLVVALRTDTQTLARLSPGAEPGFSFVPTAREAEPGSIFTDKSPRGQTSEGFYDWTVHSAGLAEREW